MRSTQIFSAVLGASILAAPLPVQAARAPAPPPGEEDSEAKQRFNARQYPEAAVAFEQLFATSHAPKYLFNAAMARELAGHEGHAYLLLRRYLALPDLQPAETERAKDRLAALQRRTAVVRIIAASSETTPLQGRDLQFTIERTATGAITDPGRLPLVLDDELLPLLAAGPDTVEIYLEQGPWVISASAEGHEPARQELAVEGGQAEVTLTLPAQTAALMAVTVTLAPSEALANAEIALIRPGEQGAAERAAPAHAWQVPPGDYTVAVRAPGYQQIDRSFTVRDQPLTLDLVLLPEDGPIDHPNPPPRRDRLALGLGVAGGVTAVAGIVVLGVGASHWTQALNRYGEFAGTNAAKWDIASGNLFKAWTLSGAGAGLLGGGLGLGLGALGMHFAPRMKNPRPMWGAGVGVGVALAVAGGLLIGRSGLGTQSAQWAHAASFSDLAASATDDQAGRNHHIGASAAMLGLGVGVGVSSLLGLIRKTRPAHGSHASLLPTGTGMVLSGRF